MDHLWAMKLFKTAIMTRMFRSRRLIEIIKTRCIMILGEGAEGRRKVDICRMQIILVLRMMSRWTNKHQWPMATTANHPHRFTCKTSQIVWQAKAITTTTIIPRELSTTMVSWKIVTAASMVILAKLMLTVARPPTSKLACTWRITWSCVVSRSRATTANS